MKSAQLEELRYPIGKFVKPEPIEQRHIDLWIETLQHLPEKLERLVILLSDEQLDTPYREGGWTVRQLVHHISDSHHHSYIRFKWALTEDRPVIKFYYEKEWAKLVDAISGPIDMSLMHLKAVHHKLVYLLKRLSDKELDKSFIHPEENAEVSLKENIGKYAWHSDHHYAHIKNLLERKGWLTS